MLSSLCDRSYYNLLNCIVLLPTRPMLCRLIRYEYLISLCAKVAAQLIGRFTWWLSGYWISQQHLCYNHVTLAWLDFWQASWYYNRIRFDFPLEYSAIASLDEYSVTQLLILSIVAHNDDVLNAWGVLVALYGWISCNFHLFSGFVRQILQNKQICTARSFSSTMASRSNKSDDKWVVSFAVRDFHFPPMWSLDFIFFEILF